MTIFEYVAAKELKVYWETYSKDRAPFMGEELFPSDKKLGLKLDWIKGSKGLPVVLKPSALDAKSSLRPRIGLEKLSSDMPFFKESMLIDEHLRQELNKVIETGNANYIDAVLNNIFNDEMTLLEGAAAQRERMRMMALTTGAITIEANGQIQAYDYGMPENHKGTVTTDWSDPNADIIGDIERCKEVILEDTGVVPTRATCSGKTLGYLTKNAAIQKVIYVQAGGNVTITKKRVKDFFLNEYDIDIVENDKRFIDESGNAQKYVADDTFVLFPEGNLGTTWFGTTPEESDLLSSNVANVSIVDKGVAITTSKMVDPVNVDTKVSMICLPSFEKANEVYILEVKK